MKKIIIIQLLAMSACGIHYDLINHTKERQELNLNEAFNLPDDAGYIMGYVDGAPRCLPNGSTACVQNSDCWNGYCLMTDAGNQCVEDLDGSFWSEASDDSPEEGDL